MKKFPEISEPQVTLLWADFKTGHILDSDFIAVTKENQEPYNIFDNVKAAVEYAKLKIIEKGDLECVIQGVDEERIHYITPENVKNF